jgi:hypothetical protein
VVAGILILAAALLEALQCLRPDHTPNPLAALSSIGGVIVGYLIVTRVVRLADLRKRATEAGAPASDN